MRNLVKKLMLSALALIFALPSFGQMVVDNTITVNDLVNDHLVGENVQVFNITINGVAGGDSAYTNIGLFDATNSNIPIDEGIVMGPMDVMYVADGTGGSGGTLPDFYDIDLDSIANPFTIQPSQYAVLEFDFIPQGEMVVFRYVFSSEEYPTYVCSSFNDAFGFFISGPGITGEYSSPPAFPGGSQNIAIIPGTDLPVTINTVNDGNVGSAGNMENCSEEGLANSEFFIANYNAGPTDCFMDGFTVVLEASSPVECGEMYHLKMAISNTSDGALDSGVFLEGGSFGAIPIVEIDIETPTDSSLVGEGCQIDFKFNRLLDQEADTVLLIVEGTATEGEDFEELPEYIIFEAGQSEYTLPITGIYDGIEEGIEDITMKMKFFSCGDTLEFSATAFIEDAYPLEVEVGRGEYCREFDGYAGLEGNASGGYGELTYYWTRDSIGGEPSDPSDPTNPYPTDDPLIVSYHYLTVHDECILSKSSAEAYILENKCPVIAPNIFTPNGDGENDKFVIQNMFLFPNSQLRVYNRWGQMVYESLNYINNWDGDGLPDGTYFWTLTLSDHSPESVVNGYVTIAR